MGYKSKQKQKRRSEKSSETSVPSITAGKNSFGHNTVTMDRYALERREEEKLWQDMKKECDAIIEHKYNLNSEYQRARVLLYQALLEDRANDDRINPKVDADIKEAGKILYADGGMNFMHDSLLWAFIPKRVHRYIDNAWNGIGGWLS